MRTRRNHEDRLEADSEAADLRFVELRGVADSCNVFNIGAGEWRTVVDERQPVAAQVEASDGCSLVLRVLKKLVDEMDGVGIFLHRRLANAVHVVVALRALNPLGPLLVQLVKPI